MKKVMIFVFTCVVLITFSVSLTAAGDYWFASILADGSNYQFKDFNGNVINCKQVTAVLKGHENDWDNEKLLYAFLESDHSWMVSLLADKGDPVFGGKFNPFLMVRREDKTGEIQFYGYATQYTTWLFDKIIKDPAVNDIVDIYGRDEWLLLDFAEFRGNHSIKHNWENESMFGFTVRYKDGRTEGLKFRGVIEIIRDGNYVARYYKQSYVNGDKKDEELIWKFYFTNEGLYKVERSTDGLIVAELISYQPNSKDDFILIVVDPNEPFDISSKGKTVSTWGAIKKD